MSSLAKEETQLQTEDIETTEPELVYDEEEEIEAQESDTELPVAVTEVQPKKREKREAVELEREPGKTLLPFSRVQKIIKADKEIPIVAKEATFLIALATEEFIKRLCEASQHVAHREKRSTVQHKDLATVARRADEFLFLEEIMLWTSADAPAKRTKPKTTVGGKTTMLDKFVTKDADEDGEEEEVIMNEDGTMYAANAAVEYEL
ncbi:DNA polymerase epsilon subunit C [Psilocybe cubensis]|uniref:Transcription factor CBF/NF-Y/archaeal histone domain-containing protein n=2 Tax=Psilocybe cubensis TaxID=181762 RepID=A0A8H7XPE4_PSICU|nr:DNA polymerase epsilon subunit C [Psilocybe cubensis]KAH9480544.1 DNA polymerase epsilon subunit C [Psilocybe cubensis]